MVRNNVCGAVSMSPGRRDLDIVERVSQLPERQTLNRLIHGTRQMPDAERIMDSLLAREFF